MLRQEFLSVLTVKHDCRAAALTYNLFISYDTVDPIMGGVRRPHEALRKREWQVASEPSE